MKDYNGGQRARPANVALIGIAFTWAGLILGSSFVETPLKFRAPGITEVLAVGIGRLVFTVLNRIELVLAVLLLSTMFLSKRSRPEFLLPGMILMLLFTQTFWLLPLLDARAQLLLAGNPTPPSFHHLLFIGIEAAKVITLLVLGTVAARNHTA